MTPDEIAASRPPDRVTYSEWEPVFGPSQKRLVATKSSLFRVLEYTEVEDSPITGWRRRRLEHWDRRLSAVMVDDHITMSEEPHVGRWTWEYSDGL